MADGHLDRPRRGRLGRGDAVRVGGRGAEALATILLARRGLGHGAGRANRALGFRVRVPTQRR